MVTEALAQPNDRAPPRQRILEVAADLIYRRGIRAVGVDAIAEAAGTNKMTLYRHFASKDELVAEYLRRASAAGEATWDRLARLHPGDARAQLTAWLDEIAGHLTSGDQRGCALANAAVELPEKDRPVRRVIEECKLAQSRRLAAVCAEAGLSDPEGLADELGLLVEGARMVAQSVGPEGLKDRLRRMGDAVIAAHAR